MSTDAAARAEAGMAPEARPSVRDLIDELARIQDTLRLLDRHHTDQRNQLVNREARVLATLRARRAHWRSTVTVNDGIPFGAVQPGKIVDGR